MNRYLTSSKSLLLSWALLLYFCILSGCGNKSGTFTLDDFYSFEKIDAHIHVNTEKSAFLEQAAADNFRLLTLNTDVPYYPPIAEQQRLALFQIKAFPGRIAYATTFTLDGWENPDWADKTISYLENSFENGAIAVKVWKNIGMSFRDRDGNFVMIDHPKFDPIFEYLAKKKIPVVGHLGEPKNCWLPVEEMTVNNDKEYFKAHPEYHMYVHPEFPSYEDQIHAIERRLERHPDLKFIGAHLGSLEWSVNELAKRLDKFPNMAVDFAHRMGHIQYQSIRDREKVQDFFIQYQDRLIYGSDLKADGTDAPEDLKKRLQETWLSHWKYFTTDEMMTAPEVNGEFRGLALPREVVEKIYRTNAEKWFSGI